MRVALFPPFSHQTEHTPTCTVAKILSLSLSLSSRLAPAKKKEKNERRNEEGKMLKAAHETISKRCH
jgi:hypothetical protein